MPPGTPGSSNVIARILAVPSGEARGLRKLMVAWNRRSYGGVLPGIHEATALVSFFNFSGRMEAASGLPMDRIPAGARFAEGTPEE